MSIKRQFVLTLILDLHRHLNHGAGRKQFQFKRQQAAGIRVETQRELFAAFVQIGNGILREEVRLAGFFREGDQRRPRYRPFGATFPT